MNLKYKLADMQTKKLAYIDAKDDLNPVEETCFADESDENAIQVELVRHVDRYTELFCRVPPLYYIELPSQEELGAIDIVRLIPKDLKWNMNEIPMVEIQGLLKGFGFEASIVDVERCVPEEFFKVNMWPEPHLNDNERYEVRKQQKELFWSDNPKLSKTFKALKVDF